MTDVIIFFVQQILLQGALFLGIFGAVGAILARKSTLEVFETFVKTAAGIAILSAGASLLVGAFNPLGALMIQVFGFEGLIVWNIPSWNYGLTLVPPDFPVNVALAAMLTLFLGFVLNLLAARFTPVRTIYLTPHMMNHMATAEVVAIAYYLPDIGFMSIVAIASIAVAAQWIILPEISRRLSTKYWIPDGAYTVGHCLEATAAVLGKTAQALGGKPEDSIEKRKVPDSLRAIADYIVISMIIALGMFVTVALIAGPELVPSGTTHYLIWAVVQSINFTGGVVVMITGIQMFIGSMMPAFKGISERLIPGAIMAYDVPIIFPLGPRALTIGAATALVVQPLITVTMGIMGFPVVPIPNAISIFFHGAADGIYGDKMAGWKGAIFVSALGCAAEFLLAAIVVYPLTGPLYGKGFTWMGPDSNIFYAIWWGFLKLITGR